MRLFNFLYFFVYFFEFYITASQLPKGPLPALRLFNGFTETTQRRFGLFVILSKLSCTAKERAGKSVLSRFRVGTLTDAFKCFQKHFIHTDEVLKQVTVEMIVFQFWSWSTHWRAVVADWLLGNRGHARSKFVRIDMLPSWPRKLLKNHFLNMFSFRFCRICSFLGLIASPASKNSVGEQTFQEVDPLRIPEQ